MSTLGNRHGSGGRMGGAIDADRIFQRHTVSDIRQMYGKYVEEMKEKEEKLRHVVGDSYRDLISSADAIKDIAEQCHVVAEKLSTLMETSEGVSEMPSSATGPGQDEEVEKVYWVASKVKYMVDSQEAIYGHLDRDEYLRAAVRYLRAVEMHKEFDASCGEHARQFPFLEHLWPSVRRLDGEIWNRGQEWLTQQESIDVDSGASVLACLALLRPLDSNDVLKYLVTSRRNCILAKGRQGEDVSDLVGVMFESMWSTVCLIMEVFGDSGQKPMVRLLETLVDEEVDGKSSSSTQTLSSRARDAMSKLEGFTKGALQLETEDWLRKTSHDVQQILEPLFSATTSCRELKHIEEHVQDRLSRWRCCVHQGDDVMDMSCSALSQYAMGDIVSLWDQTCQDLVVTQAKKIISTRFRDVSDIVEKMTAEALSQSKNEAVTVDPIGQYTASTVYKDLNTVSSGAAEREWWIQVASEFFDEIHGALEKTLAESIECLSIGNKKYASNSDEEFVSFEDFISQEFASAMKSMVSLMEATRLNATRDTVIGLSLVFVQLASKILYSCEPFQKLLHFQEVARDGDNYDSSVLHPWARETLKRIQDLRTASNETWSKWFNGEIARQIRQSGSYDILPSSSSAAQDDASGSTTVPSFPSSWLMGALTCFCEELEKAGGSALQEDLVKQAMGSFKSTMLATALEMEEEDPSTSRDGVLQRIYDIRFICSLFGDDAAVRATAKSVLDSLGARIDPIDWSGCSSAIDENVAVFSSSAASFLRISNAHDSSGVSRDNDGNGIMALSTTTSRFAYLPAKLPSRPNKMSAYGLSNSVDDDGSSLGNMSSSVTAQSAITSLLGTKAAEMSAKIEGYTSGGLLGSFFTN
ncbi:hypothetical protein M9434_000868 [Picochlorum sp. BPE23]|nr:hypothetical protein M9434_000868 [Picochlorum sp. BPE23]